MISSILLAAGLSSRMKGENKLIKEIKGIPLINYSIKNILASSVDEIVVVTGYESEKVENIIGKHKKIKFVYNKDFKNGISSSIKKGLNTISNKAEAFFICLGDMPNVNQNIYNKLIKSRFNYNKKLRLEHKKEIIIPTFDGKNGNPVLFSKFMKDKIMLIEGDSGAKNIIELNKNKVLNVSFDNEAVILDFDIQEHFNFS
ncbi:nucleotidyltransferase family protein [Pelagibacteraceae bacterium]|nr:nucleotidyltransferase family protein [Pelagibacteraceae bacterium]